ncbi:hypothetical protein DL93DRAFT_2085961 [Clavulina sp. PMI_390]|nr:hypothetical protein DL93DRAFT_2085961 [Clavulina sp. PMI_390]
MADIAAWMERVEYEHGPEGMESHVIDRLRAFAFEMEANPDMPRPLDPQTEAESLTSGEHDGTEASVQGLEASSPATSAQPSETKSQSKPSRHDPDIAQTGSFIIY